MCDETSVLGISVSGLIKINSIIGGKRQECVLDSGAGVNVINQNLVKDLNIISIDSHAFYLKFANGEKVKTSVIILVPVTFLSVTKNQYFVVTKNLPCNVVLGLGFWKDFSISITASEQDIRVSTGGNEEVIQSAGQSESHIQVSEESCHLFMINTVSESHKDIKVSLPFTVHINPGVMKTIICQESPLSTFSRFNSSLLTMQRLKVNILPQACVMPQEPVTVMIKNMSDRQVIIPSGTTVGFLQQAVAPVMLNEVHDDEFSLSPDLTNRDRHDLLELLHQNEDVFAESLSDLPGTSILEQDINLVPGARPVFKRPYRLANIERSAVSAHIQEMLDGGIIEPSQSNFASPFFFVPKKNGKLRFVSDFRELNKITVRDAYTLPRIDTVLESLGGNKYFTTMDMFSGYYQMFVKKEDRYKTAFITDDGLFQYVRSPMGLINSGSKFQRLLDIVLAGVKPKHVVCYVDDCMVFGRTMQEHNQNLQLVFNRIRDANLRFSKSKSKFAFSSIVFLGVVVSEEGFTPDPDKVKALTKIPTPKNITDVRSFIGMANYYRTFIPKFSTVVSPIVDLTKKESAFNWGPPQEAARQSIIQLLSQPPVLIHFQDDKPLVLVCDASGKGIASVLCHDLDGEERPIAFHSRTLNSHEQKYTVSEQELLAIIHGIKKNRQFLVGRRFKIVSDHHSLCFLLNLKDPHGRLARMALYLCNYDFDIHHRKGKDNCVADCLSRSPLPEKLPEDQDTDLGGTILMIMSHGCETLKQQQQADPYCKSIVQSIHSQNHRRRGFLMNNGILTRRIISHDEAIDLIVLPKSMTKAVLEQCHDAATAGHLGVTKTYYRIHTRFYQPRLWKTVRKYVISCDKCQKRKPRNDKQMANQFHLQHDNTPFRTIALDYKGPLTPTSRGNKHILVLMDSATRWCEAKAVKKQNSEETLAFLQEVFLRFGFPTAVCSDKGSPFVNHRVHQYLNDFGIKQQTTVAYNPAANGLVEQMNKNIGIMLAILSEDHSSWDLMLPHAIFAHNSSLVESIGCSPFERLFGARARIPLDNFVPNEGEGVSNRFERIQHFKRLAAERIAESQQKSNETAIRKFKLASLSPGEQVLLHRPQVPRGISKTLYSPWSGPWTVTQKMPNLSGTYEITRDGKTYVTNITNLRRYVCRDIESGSQAFSFNDEHQGSVQSQSHPEQTWHAVIPGTHQDQTSAEPVPLDIPETQNDLSIPSTPMSGNTASSTQSTPERTTPVRVRVVAPEDNVQEIIDNIPTPMTRASRTRTETPVTINAHSSDEQQEQPVTRTASGRITKPPVRFNF